MAGEIRQLQNEIHAWANEVFPDRTPYRQLAKLVLEEIPELLRDHFNDEIDPHEFADCLIILFDIAKQKGIDIEQAVREKMAINRQRVWKVDPVSGLMHHVKPPRPAGGCTFPDCPEPDPGSTTHHHVPGWCDDEYGNLNHDPEPNCHPYQKED